MARRHRCDSAPMRLGHFPVGSNRTASWFWARGVAAVFMGLLGLILRIRSRAKRLIHKTRQAEVAASPAPQSAQSWACFIHCPTTIATKPTKSTTSHREGRRQISGLSPVAAFLSFTSQPGRGHPAERYATGLVVDYAQVNSMESPSPGPWDGDLGEGNSPSPLP